MTDDEIASVEAIVNQKIRENITKKEDRKLPIEAAKKAGAMMLFGEKYGDEVRMITFDENYSIELCGGCHVPATGVIGLFKITTESAIAAGVRRIEAVTAAGAETYVNDKLEELDAIRSIFKSPNVVKSIVDLQEENKSLKKEIEKLQADKAAVLQQSLASSAKAMEGVQFVSAHIKDMDGKTVKNLAYNLLGVLENGVVVFAIEEGDKVQIMVAIAEGLTQSTQLHAGNMVKTLAPLVDGGGGGQAFFATAGGKKKEGIGAALSEAEKLVAGLASQKK